MKTLIGALLLFSSYTILAQVQQLTTDASLIIEGTVISVDSYWNKDKTQIITDNQVIIEHIFKGIPTDSIISISTIGGAVDEYIQFSPHAIELSSGQSGFFFLKKENEDDHYHLFTPSLGFYPIYDNINPKVALARRVYTKTNFENKILSATRFPKYGLDFIEKSLNNQYGSTRDSCDILLAYNNDADIGFSFDNIQYTGDLTYLEFDIVAETNTPGLKFSKGQMFVQYSQEFGSSVVTNQSVEVSKGQIIQDSSYTISYEDSTSQLLLINIEPSTSQNNFYSLTSSPEPLLHFKLKIADFSNIGQISFGDVDVTGLVYYWCRGGHSPFDQIGLNDPIMSVEPQPDSEIGITYTFENGSVIEDNTKYRVDIMAEATSTSKYSGGNIEVVYNIDAFGSNVISSGNAVFQRGPLIDDSSVYTLHQVGDLEMTDNIIQILTFSDPAITSGRSTLGTNKEKVGTLTFDILDCSADKGIGFDQFGTVTIGNHNHYTGETPVPNEDYDPVIADDIDDGQVCNCPKPVITSFEPTEIRAGTGEILTIHGENFGQFDQGTSTVIFKNGDDDGDPEMEANYTEFQWSGTTHWQDGIIKVKVPSVDKNLLTKHPACTGEIKVRSSCKESDPSDEKLKIPYGIQNYRNTAFTSPKKTTLKETEPGFGICFSFSDSIPLWIETEFKNALGEWCSATGIDFRFFSGSVPENENALDSINLISYKFDASSAVGGSFATDPAYYGDQGCENTERGFIYSELDITIVSGTTGMNPPNQVREQLREVIKHELGHAHMLTHARNGGLGGIQYLMAPNGNPLGTITSSDLQGANQVFTNSANIVHSQCGNPIGSGNCGFDCPPNNIPYNPKTEPSVSINPNPSDGHILITLSKSSIKTPGKIVISDYSGRRIKVVDFSASAENIPIKLSGMSGMYIIHVIQGQNSSVHKVIVE